MAQAGTATHGQAEPEPQAPQGSVITSGGRALSPYSSLRFPWQRQLLQPLLRAPSTGTDTVQKVDLSLPEGEARCPWSRTGDIYLVCLFLEHQQ